MFKTRWTTVLPVIVSTEPKLFAAWLRKNLGVKVVRGKLNGEVIYIVAFRPDESYVLVEAKSLNTRAGVLTISLSPKNTKSFDQMFDPPPDEELPSTNKERPSTEGGKVYKIWSKGDPKRLIAYIRVSTIGH